MLKTIKETKLMRLDELIKYVWEDDGSLFEERELITFCTEDNKKVIFDDTGYFESLNWFDPEDLFLVEIEKKITGDTVFDELVERYESKATPYKSTDVHINSSIKDILKPNRYTESESTQIYALIDDELQLIWKKKD